MTLVFSGFGISARGRRHDSESPRAPASLSWKSAMPDAQDRVEPQDAVHEMPEKGTGSAAGALQNELSPRVSCCFRERRMADPVISLLLTAAFAASAVGAWAQSTDDPVNDICRDAPPPGEEVPAGMDCTKDDGSTADIEIYREDAQIVSNEVYGAGIIAVHQQDGGIDIVLKNSTVFSEAIANWGIFAQTVSEDAQGVHIQLENSRIETENTVSDGIILPGSGTLGIDIDLRSSAIWTQGFGAKGISTLGAHGDIHISLDRSAISTQQGYLVLRLQRGGLLGGGSHGIDVAQTSQNSDVIIRLQNDSLIITRGSGSGGIFIRAQRGSRGDIAVHLDKSRIITSGEPYFCSERDAEFRDSILVEERKAGFCEQGDIVSTSQGIFVAHRGKETGAGIVLHDSSINTVGDRATGIIVGAQSESAGDIIITLHDSSIITAGDDATAIYALSFDATDNDIDIKLLGDSAVTTMGANAHGIFALQSNDPDDAGMIDITVDGKVVVTGEGATGVLVGLFPPYPSPFDALLGNAPAAAFAPFDDDGFRRQTVTLNGEIESSAVGILLTAGGRVSIGPEGSIRSDEGVVIHAAGTVLGEDAIHPRLSVDLNLNSRKGAVEEMIGNGWIINTGGGTSITVNGVQLHDAETGVTGLTAPNGAYDIAIRSEGVTIEERIGAGPEEWRISTPTAGVIADRDFSSADFAEFYAPRSAVYEALPGFLQNLDALDIPRRAEPGQQPGWIRFSGGAGTHEAKRSRVGAQHDFDRQLVEAGIDIPLTDSISGSVSVRSLLGTAEVSAPTGGGKILASGLGARLGLSYQGTNGFYALGGYSRTDYTLDMFSDTRGALMTNVSAAGYSLHAETGMRFDLSKGAFVTPRAMMTHGGIGIDNFTDAVGTRVSFDSVSRRTAAVGFVVESAAGLKGDGGGLGLRGSLDIERTLGASETVTHVSGTRLFSQGPKTWLNLGIGVAGRSDRHVADMGLSVRGLGSDDTQLSVRIGVKVEF